MRLRAPMPNLDGAVQILNREISLMSNMPTIVYFWSVGCSLCKEALPLIHQLRDEYVDCLNVIAVHVSGSDEGLDIHFIQETAKRYSIVEPILVDSNQIIKAAFENKCTPAYYLFDKTGVLRHFQAGRSGMDMLRRRIERVVSE